MGRIVGKGTTGTSSGEPNGWPGRSSDRMSQSAQVRQALGAMRPELLQALWEHYKLLHNVVYETQHRGDSPGPITGSKNQDRTGDAV
jgi:hypothetical protein